MDKAHKYWLTRLQYQDASPRFDDLTKPGRLHNNGPSLRHKRLFLLVALAFCAPIITILTRAHYFAESLPDAGCLSDGTFAIFGTTSISDLSQFLVHQRAGQLVALVIRDCQTPRYLLGLCRPRSTSYTRICMPGHLSQCSAAYYGRRRDSVPHVQRS
jgi:hypothetical protein